jgi:Ankyrin repeats (many copies)
LNLSEADYDKRTPLHVACAYNRIEMVKYLLDQGVDVNPVDRWGSTPLSDAQNKTEITNILKARGGKYGVAQIVFEGKNDNVTEDQYRFFYAAYYGDI